MNMNKQQNSDTTIRIPVITDLISPGDPDIIRRAKSGESVEYQKNFEKRLKERIAELQSAAGQDEYPGLGRAHAIRSEAQEGQDSAPAPMNKDYEKQIDQQRGELMRELSVMLEEQRVAKR